MHLIYLITIINSRCLYKRMICYALLFLLWHKEPKRLNMKQERGKSMKTICSTYSSFYCVKGIFEHVSSSDRDKSLHHHYRVTRFDFWHTTWIKLTTPEISQKHKGVFFHNTAYSRHDVPSRDVFERCENMNGLILNSSALFKKVLLPSSALNSFLELILK